MVSTERSVREAVETIARPEHPNVTNNMRSGETPDQLITQPFRVSAKTVAYFRTLSKLPRFAVVGQFEITRCNPTPAAL